MNMLLEESCAECDAVVTALVDKQAFVEHKAGRVRCPECGAAIRPCNGCDEHDKCDECPYAEAAIVATQGGEEGHPCPAGN